jgi:hypothetical protein
MKADLDAIIIQKSKHKEKNSFKEYEKENDYEYNSQNKLNVKQMPKR